MQSDWHNTASKTFRNNFNKSTWWFVPIIYCREKLDVARVILGWVAEHTCFQSRIIRREGGFCVTREGLQMANGMHIKSLAMAWAALGWSSNNSIYNPRAPRPIVFTLLRLPLTPQIHQRQRYKLQRPRKEVFSPVLSHECSNPSSSPCLLVARSPHLLSQLLLTSLSSHCSDSHT